MASTPSSAAVMAGLAPAIHGGLWALAFTLAAFAALTFPPLAGRVTDAANILPPATRQALEAKLKELEDKSSIQLVVATVPSLQGTDVETYANGLFRSWKLGEKERNNGALLLVAPNERKVRVEVGYGLEGTLTDALSSVIIQSTMIPRFKAGDFSGGIERGVDALVAALSDDQSEWHRKARVRKDADGDALDTLMPLILLLLFVFIIVMMTRQARRGHRGGGPVIIPMNTSWGGSSWRGGSSWGGGGGDSFSGGGGSSGGGGASGSW